MHYKKKESSAEITSLPPAQTEVLEAEKEEEKDPLRKN